MVNYEEILGKLESGEIENITIQKEDFYSFREVLIKHPKFKHFRGDAKQGGTVIYTYLEDARS